MRFKDSWLPNEFKRAHPHVKAIALYLDQHCVETFAKDLMVTDVERSQAEYDVVYKTLAYSGPKPHLADEAKGIVSHAVDFRTMGELTDAQVQALVAHMNAGWPRADGKTTALFHNVGQGSHLHLQAEI